MICYDLTFNIYTPWHAYFISCLPGELLGTGRGGVGREGGKEGGREGRGRGEGGSRGVERVRGQRFFPVPLFFPPLTTLSPLYPHAVDVCL